MVNVFYKITYFLLNKLQEMAMLSKNSNINLQFIWYFSRKSVFGMRVIQVVLNHNSQLFNFRLHSNA
ncbi:MAG: hypothetical protein CFE22_02585 [Cytophagaceae bacterium BCCC1]|nr:MAG: hypothetical protein CFE22_02585 [Cytophagaceae bacterium BCCC1]